VVLEVDLLAFVPEPVLVDLVAFVVADFPLSNEDYILIYKKNFI
jgi:hypothetical protein